MVEGMKSVLELLRSSFQVDLLIGTTEAFAENNTLFQRPGIEWIGTNAEVLASLGAFKANHTVMAVARMKPNAPFLVQTGEFVLALDDVRDPGNLGTILRIADWYGITKVVTTEETADFYNPKTIQASMGSFTRVSYFETDLTRFLSEVEVDVYGAFLEGENVHRVRWNSGGVVVIGSESHGISKEVEGLVTKRITIPRFGGAESLNAAIATAVICDNIRRKK